MPHQYTQSLSIDVDAKTMVDVIQSVFAQRGQNAIVTTTGVMVRSGISWASWGEEISVALHPGSPGTTVTIQSKCVYPAQFIDWGRNKKNVDALFRDISAALGTQPQA